MRGWQKITLIISVVIIILLGLFIFVLPIDHYYVPKQNAASFASCFIKKPPYPPAKPLPIKKYHVLLGQTAIYWQKVSEAKNGGNGCSNYDMPLPVGYKLYL